MAAAGAAAPASAPGRLQCTRCPSAAATRVQFPPSVQFPPRLAAQGLGRVAAAAAGALQETAQGSQEAEGLAVCLTAVPSRLGACGSWVCWRAHAATAQRAAPMRLGLTGACLLSLAPLRCSTSHCQDAPSTQGLPVPQAAGLHPRLAGLALEAAGAAPWLRTAPRRTATGKRRAGGAGRRGAGASALRSMAGCAVTAAPHLRCRNGLPSSLLCPAPAATLTAPLRRSSASLPR